MKFNELLKQKGYSIYKISKNCNIAFSTLFDIYTGKSKIFDCRGRILYKLATFLDISIEDLLFLEQEKYNISFEEELPLFLSECLNNIKRYRNKKDNFYDCYSDELNSSINVAEIENLISKEQANYLREKYLGA